MYLQKIISRFVLITMVALLVASCGGAEERKAKYLAKSQEYFDNENYEKARVEVKNVLQIDPKYSQGYYMLGQIEEKLGAHKKAFGVYNKAVELDSNNIDAKCRLGRYYLISNLVKQAQEFADAVVKVSPDHECGNLLLATLIYKDGKSSKAIDKLKDIIKKHPATIDVIILLQHIYSKENKRFEAIAALEKALIRTNNNIMILKMLSNQYAIQKKDKEFVETINEIIAKEPENFKNRAALASYHAANKNLDKAAAVLRDAIKEEPEDSVRYATYAQFIEKSQGLPDAIKAIEKYLNESPDNNKIRFNLGLLYVKSKAFDKAEAVYQYVVENEKTGLDWITAQNAIASIKLLNSDTESASSIIEEVLKETPSNIGALKLKAKILLSTGDMETAIIPLRTIFKEQPDSVDMAILLADTHARLEQRGLGRDVLKQGLQYNPGDKLLILKHAQLVAIDGDIDKAISEIDNALIKHENDLELLKAKTPFVVKTKDVKKLREHFNVIINTNPTDAHGYFEMGRLDVTQKKLDSAINFFEKALDVDKRHVESLGYIIRIYKQSKLDKKAIDRINSFISEGRNKGYGYNLLGEFEKGRKNYPSAIKAFQQAMDNSKNWATPFGNLGHLYYMTGDIEKALSIFSRGLEANPKDATLLYSMANHYEKAKSYEKAAKYYRQTNKGVGILKIKLDAINNLAYLLVEYMPDEKNISEAVALTEILTKANNIIYMDTVAWVKFKAGKVDEARQILEKVVQQYPADRPFAGIFNYHLGRIYLELGNKELARKHLKIARDSKDIFDGKQGIDTLLK